MKKEWKHVEGIRCMRGKDGVLNFGVTDRGRAWKEIMNEENEWDHMTEVNEVEGPIEEATWEEMVLEHTMKIMKGVLWRRIRMLINLDDMQF